MVETDLSSLSWWTSFFVGLTAVLMTAGTCYIGLAFKQLTRKQYLHGGQQMAALPIAVSLIGSVISGITLLNIPVQVYLHGTQLLTTLLSVYIALAIVMFFILPRLYDQRYNSLFEFLEHRYSKKTREIISTIFVLKTVLYLPFVISSPAASFSKVTALPTHLTIFALSLMCTFYTTIGGFKGVVWSQCLQVFFMAATILAIIFIGSHSIGGFDKVLEVADTSGRLELFNLNPDLYTECNVLTSFTGIVVSWLYFLGVNPGSYQKLVSLPRQTDAAKALMWFGVGVTLVKLLLVFLGLTVYAEFSDCDPLSNGEVDKGQLMLYYIWEKSKKYTYIEALFSAGLLSAAFSFMSTNLNTVSGVIYEDFVKTRLSGKLKEYQAVTHIKRITVLAGALITLLTLFCNRLNPVLVQLLLSVHRFTDGAIVAAFLIGLYQVYIKSKVIIVATLFSVASTCLVAYSYYSSIAAGEIFLPLKPMSTVGCSENINSPYFHLNVSHRDTLHLLTGKSDGVFMTNSHTHAPRLYTFSMYHFTTVGICITIVASMLWSEFALSVHQGQTMGNLIDVALLAYEPKRKNAYMGIKNAGQATDKEVEMTTVKEEREIPKVHDTLHGKGK